MLPNMAPVETAEGIPTCLSDEERVSLLDHKEDSVQRHYLSDVGHESDPDFDLVVAHPQKYNVGWLTELGCPCGVPRCKGKHAVILETRQTEYQHLWTSLPEHVYEGIVKHLD